MIQATVQPALKPFKSRKLPSDLEKNSTADVSNRFTSTIPRWFQQKTDAVEIRSKKHADGIFSPWRNEGTSMKSL